MPLVTDALTRSATVTKGYRRHCALVIQAYTPKFRRGCFRHQQVGYFNWTFVFLWRLQSGKPLRELYEVQAEIKGIMEGKASGMVNALILSQSGLKK